jgi:hypothetical protein
MKSSVEQGFIGAVKNMQEPEYQYTKELYERFGYMSTWKPAVGIKLSDVGELDRNVFRRVGI